MRIEELKIVGYQILRDITIRPGQVLPTPDGRRLPSSIDLLVGVNGTGKTTLLRALAIIFQCLEQDNCIPPFGFAITYFLDEQPQKIFISNLASQTNTLLPLLRFRLGEEPENTVSKIREEYLPRHIIALTSGSEMGWIYNGAETNEADAGILSRDFQPEQTSDFEKLLQAWDLTEVRGVPSELHLAQLHSNPTSRFQLITGNLIPYIVLCGLLSDMCNDSQYLQTMLEAAKIKKLSGFSLQLYLNKDQIAQDHVPFITRLWDCATYIIQTGQNYLLVFLFDDREGAINSPLSTEESQRYNLPKQLLGDAGDGLAFFTEMLPLIVTDEPNNQIIRKVNLFLKSARPLPQTSAEEMSFPEQSSLYLFDWLSDGEQSLLGRLCLLPLLSYTEALVLLDEPEVHFNDFWKRQLLQMLHHSLQQQKPGQRPTSSHILMTTHSSITLSDVANTNIWILERDDDHQSRATQPHLRTLGTDPSDIIVHIFRADSAVGAFSAAYIREQLVAAEKKSPKERLEMLNELLKRVGPGYWRYLIRREILSLEAPQLWNALTAGGETPL
jgi:energy-coupling factor transporter ATP-binding protein EcfA2